MMPPPSLCLQVQDVLATTDLRLQHAANLTAGQIGALRQRAHNWHTLPSHMPDWLRIARTDLAHALMYTLTNAEATASLRLARLAGDGSSGGSSGPDACALVGPEGADTVARFITEYTVLHQVGGRARMWSRRTRCLTR